jgi:hypothetical protein
MTRIAVVFAREESPFSNFPEIAGFYSQLAAVLAGFVFAGLITLIAAQLVSGNVADMALRSYRPLVSAFAGLVATSFNYAIIAGEDRDTGRLAELEVTAGLGFCVAAALMFYSIIVLLRGVEYDLSTKGAGSGRTANLLRSTLVFGVSPLLVVLEYGAIGDHLLVNYPTVAFRGVDLLVIVALLMTAGVAVLVTRRYPERTKDSAFARQADAEGMTRSDRLVDRLSRAGMVIAILSLLTSTITLNFVEKKQHYSDYLSAACLVILAIFMWTMMYSVATYRPGVPSAARQVASAPGSPSSAGS